MKKIKLLMIWIGLLLSLVSCKDTMEAIGLGGDEIPAEGLVLTLQLTNFTKQQIGTRAGGSETFKSLCAVFYGDNNEYKGKTDCYSTLSQQPDGSYKVKITNVPAGTKNVHLVANASDMTDSEAQDLQSLTAAKERDPQLDAPICWGEISIDKLLEANHPSVTMLRQCAKISLEIDKGIQSNFTNAGLYVYSMATKAAIAPANYTDYTEPTTHDLAESTDLKTEDNPLGDGTTTTLAVNETSAGKAMVIIKANYNRDGKDREGYYKVALYKDNNKTTQYALRRNHHYTIKVTKVNDYGFSTLEEAKKSLPENRVEVEVVDDNPEITQMIACKDYELGVSDYQEVDASTTKAIVTIVTTLPDATSSDDWLYSVQKNASWITACDQETVNDTPETGRKSSKGKKYTLKLTLTKNDQSEEPRIGTITVTYGDLSLDITIKQAGFDFRRDDPDRIVTMQYKNSTRADNYFNWLDGVQGITPEDMQGAVRNDGLHFCVGTTDITYLIPKLDGDQITKKDNKINVEEDDGKWKVSLANTTANKELWKASFTIKNQAGIEITYPVYHTGIFHYIDGSDKVYTDYQLTENGDKVKGWFYYGVVKVEGKKADGTTTTYYMLDRNLGASNNGYYAPDVVALANNKKAIGGYFCISKKQNTNDANQDLSSDLAPKGYTIPTDAVFEELVNAGNLEVVQQSTSLGETYNCVRIKTVDSELPYIYLPMGGFLEGESHKNPIHVNLWTKTLLAGTQGFSTTSPEYGFWYRYFDVYNKRKGLSNMRFVSGSNGMNNGRYKAMPIRLILE